MFDTRFLIRLFDRVFVLKLLFLGLLISLVPLGEILFIFYTAQKAGVFLMLAAAAFIGLIGVFSVYGQVKTIIGEIRRKVAEGVYPEDEFAALAGALLAVILFLMPGFVTDAAAVLLLLPGVKTGLGRGLVRNLDSRLKELYTYLKM